MKRLTPLKAIRRKCLDCQSGQPSKVRNCEDKECVCYIYRLGHNSKRKGIGNRNGYFLQKKQSQDKENKSNDSRREIDIYQEQNNA